MMRSHKKPFNALIAEELKKLYWDFIYYRDNECNVCSTILHQKIQTMRGGKREGAGRPPKPEQRKSITIRLPQELLAHIDQVGCTRTETIERAIAYYRLHHIDLKCRI